jgi:hypothetical protein
VLFGEADFWQHPSTFERLRTGDCEDFAVWAWRKLIELGYDVDLVAGGVFGTASWTAGTHGCWFGETGWSTSSSR